MGVDTMIHRFTPGSGPVLLLLHGTGGNEDDLLDLGQSLLPKAALLSPRGNVLENGMPRFFRRLAAGVFDIPDLIVRTHELAEFVSAARQTYELNDRPIVAVGYSNGANIAASLFLLRPEVLAGGVLLRAMLPLEPPLKPNLANVPVLLAAGRHDAMIPSAGTEALASALRAAGAEVTLEWTEGGHELHAPEITNAARWLATHFSH